jgi:Chlorophyll A-B binding protein
MQATTCASALGASLSSKAAISTTSSRRFAAPSLPKNRSSALRVSAFRENDERQVFKVPTEERNVPSFTRRRERTVGRIAMLGCAAMWAGEQLTGAGPITQLGYETGVQPIVAYGITALLAASQLVLGVNQFNPTWSDENQKDVNKRKKGITGITPIEPDVEGRIKPTEEPGKFFLRNELVLGRSAMLIFAGAAVLEKIFGGQSPLAHFGLIDPGHPVSMAPLWLKAGIVLFTAGGIGVFSAFNTNKDPDTY